MGAAVSRRLDGRGAKVVVADQDEANGRKVAASLKNGGSFFKVDLSEMPEIEKLWNYALERLG
jgi:NAD(P)-dependent dehydrogenase (short-subunit alcohol dehydrogenase family)